MLLPLVVQAILTWAEEKKSANVEDRKFAILAAPFIQWLVEAEEDESDDDEEEEEDDDNNSS